MPQIPTLNPNEKKFNYHKHSNKMKAIEQVIEDFNVKMVLKRNGVLASIYDNLYENKFNKALEVLTIDVVEKDGLRLVAASGEGSFIYASVFKNYEENYSSKNKVWDTQLEKQFLEAFRQFGI